MNNNNWLMEKGMNTTLYSKVDIKRHRYFGFNMMSLLWLVLAVYLFQSFVTPNINTFEVSIFLILIGGLIIITKFKIYICTYYILNALFIMYYVILQLFINDRQTNFSTNRLIVLLANLAVMLIIYNLIIYSREPEVFMKFFILVSFISLAVIMFLVRDSLWTSRLGHNGAGTIVSYYFMGKEIYKSSNTTARFCDIAILFSMYFAIKERKKIYYILSLYFTFAVLLTGSRKGIFLLILYLIYITFVTHKGNVLKKIVILITISIGISILIIKIPVLYELMGKRVVSLIVNILGIAQVSLDGNSYTMRKYLSQLAINYISQKPIIGHGLGIFGNDNTVDGFSFGTENNYIDILVSGGILGLILYYSYAVVAIKKFLEININSKSQCFKISFLILIGGLITDIGGVTYHMSSSLLWITVFFAFAKLEKQNNCRRIG